MNFNSNAPLPYDIKEKVFLQSVSQIFVVLAIISVGYDKMSPIKYYCRDLRMEQQR